MKSKPAISAITNDLDFPVTLATHRKHPYTEDTCTPLYDHEVKKPTLSATVTKYSATRKQTYSEDTCGCHDYETNSQEFSVTNVSPARIIIRKTLPLCADI